MKELIVGDMSCGHCQAAVTRAIKGVDGAAAVEVDLATKLVRIDSDAPLEQLRAALDEAGYPSVVKGG